MSNTTSIEAKALFSSKVLSQQVKTYIQDLSNVIDSETLIKFIQTEFVEFSNYYMALGDQEFRNSENPEDSSIDEIYILHYAIPESFKDFVLLHRDVLLQLQIAQYKATERSVNSDKLQNHFEASKVLLLKSSDALLNKIDNEHRAIFKSEKEKGKLLDSIKHSKNPWGIYKSQFETVLQQTQSITHNSNMISRTQKVFEDIKTYNTDFLDQVIADTEDLKKYLGESIKQIKALDNPENISTIITWIDRTLQSVSKENSLQDLYGNTIETKLKSLSEITLPVSSENGLLLTKKIDLNKTAKKWFDFEILPSLIDLWENKNNMISHFKHSLLNLKSSLIVEKNNKSLDVLSSQLQTLQNVHSTLSENSSKINEMKTEIHSKFNEEFRFTNIFSKDDFLEVSLQSSLNQFASGQTNVFTGLKNKLSSRFSYFNSKYEKSKLFSKKNDVEDAIETINYRMFKEDNAHYDTLFLNKNFIGDLFLLPRQDQEDMIVRSIEQWKNGFNKSVLITGGSLSGKTTFVEYIGEKYFGKNLIHLQPDSIITFGGRKFNTTKDLAEVLQNIKKGFSNAKPLVIIENLELWRDSETTLLDNTRGLLSFIASESDNAFILVTTSKQMQIHLDKRVRFSETFSSNIDVNKSSFEEIYKAIILRHGASHKILVSKDKQPLSNKHIEQNILKLSRRLNYNIGEVLQAWTFGTTMIEDNQVIYENRDSDIVDFFNTEEHIILKYVFLYKKISEIELKNFVGSVYENGYKSSLKRLVNLKILVRDTEGQLTLNPVLVMDIKKILIYRGILN